jgi:hypothetical protein
MTETTKKDKSYMIALPQNEDDIKNLNIIIERIKNSTYFTAKNINLNEDSILTNEIEYNGDTYSIIKIRGLINKFDLQK